MTNTFVVYDSQFGNTERVARAIASTLREFGTARAIHVDHVHTAALQNVDLLILGCPTHGFRPTLAMQSFLIHITRETLNNIAVACFDTRFHGVLWKHSAAPQMVKQLRSMGIEPIVPPESFFVMTMKKEGPLLVGEVKRAANWASDIHLLLSTLHPSPGITTAR